MIKFGPSGTDIAFEAAGLTSTIEVPNFIKSLGLDIFEYSFGRGVRIGEETAKKYGKEFAAKSVGISVHAPYYINFASDDQEKVLNTYGYIIQSLDALRNLGGTRCIFHPGSPLKSSRSEAVRRMMYNLNALLPILYDKGLSDMYICAETMGKINQLGTLGEIVDICKLDKCIIPCIDFGHINARGQGAIKTKADYRAIVDTLYSELGAEVASKMHIHFSKIQYGTGGEIKHLTFEDKFFGPRFDELAEVLVEYRAEPWVICESAGTQSQDARSMKNIYYATLKE